MERQNCKGRISIFVSMVFLLGTAVPSHGADPQTLTPKPIPKPAAPVTPKAVTPQPAGTPPVDAQPKITPPVQSSQALKEPSWPQSFVLTAQQKKSFLFFVSQPGEIRINITLQGPPLFVWIIDPVGRKVQTWPLAPPGGTVSRTVTQEDVRNGVIWTVSLGDDPRSQQEILAAGQPAVAGRMPSSGKISVLHPPGDPAQADAEVKRKAEERGKRWQEKRAALDQKHRSTVDQAIKDWSMKRKTNLQLPIRPGLLVTPSGEVIRKYLQGGSGGTQTGKTTGFSETMAGPPAPVRPPTQPIPPSAGRKTPRPVIRTITPAEGGAGAWVKVEGYDFEKGDQVYFQIPEYRWNLSTRRTEIVEWKDVTADTRFINPQQVDVKIPNYSLQYPTVTVVRLREMVGPELGISDPKDFLLLPNEMAAVSVEPWEGEPGQEMLITGWNFAPPLTATIYIGGIAPQQTHTAPVEVIGPTELKVKVPDIHQSLREGPRNNVPTPAVVEIQSPSAGNKAIGSVRFTWKPPLETQILPIALPQMGDYFCVITDAEEASVNYFLNVETATCGTPITAQWPRTSTWDSYLVRHNNILATHIAPFYVYPSNNVDGFISRFQLSDGWVMKDIFFTKGTTGEDKWGNPDWSEADARILESGIGTDRPYVKIAWFTTSWDTIEYRLSIRIEGFRGHDPYQLLGSPVPEPSRWFNNLR